jgi:hypothetical protein
MLAALSMLGLQTALGPAAVLDVARHVEAAAADDPPAAAARYGLLCKSADFQNRDQSWSRPAACTLAGAKHCWRT